MRCMQKFRAAPESLAGTDPLRYAYFLSAAGAKSGESKI
jgi:hypothetical protein